MKHALALDLALHHGFWGDTAAPLRAVAAEPDRLARAGIVLKASGPRALLALPDDSPAPDRIALDILTTEPRLAGLTQGWDAAAVPVIEVPADATTVAFPPDPGASLPRAPGDARLCRLLVAPRPADPRLRLICRPVQALWAYHVTGQAADGPIRVVDPARTCTFEDLGTEPLPDGRAARVLRSTRPLPLAARSDLRLRLELDQPAPYDPLALVSVLPAGGTNLRPAPDGQPPGILQSDIFICLW